MITLVVQYGNDFSLLHLYFQSPSAHENTDICYWNMSPYCTLTGAIIIIDVCIHVAAMTKSLEPCISKCLQTNSNIHFTLTASLRPHVIRYFVPEQLQF